MQRRKRTKIETYEWRKMRFGDGTDGSGGGCGGCRRNDNNNDDDNNNDEDSTKGRDYIGKGKNKGNERGLKENSSTSENKQTLFSKKIRQETHRKRNKKMRRKRDNLKEKKTRETSIK